MLSDYSPSGKTFLVLSDSKIHGCKQHKNTPVRFDVAYADVKSCKFLDFTGNKVKPNGSVVHIDLKTCDGKTYRLYAFPKAAQIARELAAHGLG